MAIQKLDKHIIGENAPGTIPLMVAPTAEQQVDKINELVDAVNAIQKEREAERFEIQEWIGILEAVRKSVNIHEKQIDELQMKAEPEPADNSEKANCQENVRLPYMQNKRLRKALGIAQSALVKLANDAYDMDEHIYIDKILNQIERITKNGEQWRWQDE